MENDEVLYELAKKFPPKLKPSETVFDIEINGVHLKYLGNDTWCDDKGNLFEPDGELGLKRFF